MPDIIENTTEARQVAVISVSVQIFPISTPGKPLLECRSLLPATSLLRRTPDIVTSNHDRARQDMLAFHLRFVGATELPRYLSESDVEQLFRLISDDAAAIRKRFRSDLRLGVSVQLVFLLSFP